MKYFLSVLSILFCFSGISQSFQKTKEMKHFKGFFDFFYEENTDKIYLKVSNVDQEFLYVNSLAAGIGSNDIGLDRGQLGETAVVKFIKAGNKLLLIEPNLKYRAVSDNLEEKKSVQEAFAQSVWYGFPIIETIETNYLIDVSSFFMSDAHGVSNRLKSSKQGTYKLDLTKSAFYLERTKAFPKNVEFEAILTFTGEAEGNFIKSVTPNSSLVTVRQHHSFIELPDSNYKMRKFDPRSGAIGMSYLDYATPVESDIKKQFIIRHRLTKKNPEALQSEPVEPIIYYLDRGAPEPIKSALLEGGSWWNQAFEAAGYKNAFQIKVLPEGVDPLDIRYNVIQWVHRSTRGWSYGASVVDPRTGEILKGHVSLGSLRIRQDYLIAQALLGIPKVNDSENELLKMALARIRQLSAHEIGHTLGFTHNFASSVNDRGSVMDYPHPYVQLTDGNIDLKDAYDVGIKEWDKVTVAYSYQDFPPNLNETQELNKIIATSLENGLKFITDSDARAEGGAHIYAHLWDNGSNPAIELNRILKVRAKAIANFSVANLGDNEPYTSLEDLFVPLYFFHRYQLEATIKLIGGIDYSYAVKNDGQKIIKPIQAFLEKEALESILNTLKVETLKIPIHLIELFPPRANGFPRTRESFNSKNGISFDALNSASTASEFALNLLFNPERASRLIHQKALYNQNLGLDELIDSVINESFKMNHIIIYDFEIQQNINHEVLQSLFFLAASNVASFQAKAITNYKLKELRKWLLTKKGSKVNQSYTQEYVVLIDDFYKNTSKYQKVIAPRIPDGAPIGSMSCDF